MSVCDGCGNRSERLFTVQTHDDRVFVFDSLQCAAPIVSPTCAECLSMILGHAVEVGSAIYCSSGCAERSDGQSVSATVHDIAG
jgi:hypothetical protein